ncbi:MAG: DHA2 family efflux MFS transporter permease subunit [Acidimicrobiales bacterium]
MTIEQAQPVPPPDIVDTGGIDPAIYHRRWLILGVLCMSLVLVVVGNSSLNVALPRLQEDLGATSTQLQWIVDAYSIVFAGLLLPSGALGDRFGRKGALQLGLATVGVASLLSTFAHSPNQLIATRALMGVGAAFVMPATLSILANVFPPGERARAIAIWAGFSGAGAAIGPVLSGFLLGHFWWGSVFFVNVPIVIVALVAGAILVPTSKDPNHGKLDPIGALLSVIALVSLLYAIIEAPTKGWGSASTLGGFLLFAVFTVAFVAWEKRSSTPMLPIEFFRNRRFSVGATTITLTFFCMFGLFFVLTQYLQFVLGFSPLKAGLSTLPLAAMLIIFAPRSAGFVARWGQARVQAIGLTLVSIGMLIIASLSPTSSYWVVAAGLVVMGIGMACTTAPATNAIVSSVPLSKSGVGSAVNDTTREVGGALGIAVLGSLVSSGYRSSMADQVTALPPEAAGVARDSVGGAFTIAQKLGPVGDHLNSVAATSFTDAMSTALIVSAIVALITAGVVLVFFPRRPAPPMGLYGPIEEDGGLADPDAATEV